MHSGSCLCGAVSFRLLSDLKAVTNCHCRMCQKQHGAAFATYASVRRSELEYLSGQELLTSYNSSGSVVRKFCGVCGSNIEWSGSEHFPDWVSIAVASFDGGFRPDNIRDVHLESKVCWLQVQEGDRLMVQAVSDTSTAEYYTWGGVCDGWHLLKEQTLSVIQERVPPSAGEVPHFHLKARQFFYVLSGTATIEFGDGSVTFGPNQGIHVPPGTPHRFVNCSSADVVFLVISSPATAGDRINAPEAV